MTGKKEEEKGEHHESGLSDVGHGLWWVPVVTASLVIGSFLAAGIFILVVGFDKTIDLLVEFASNPHWSVAWILCIGCFLSIICFLPLWPPIFILLAFVYGFWKGFGMALAIMVSAAIASFFLGRFILQSRAREWLVTGSPAAEKLCVIVERSPYWYLLLFRFLYIPLWFRNYIPGLLTVSIWPFLVSVCAHSPWICFVFAYIGSTAKDAATAVHNTHGGIVEFLQAMDWISLALFSVSFAALILFGAYGTYEYTKAMNEVEDAEVEKLVAAREAGGEPATA
mmetsp:Transcript_40205/g.96354  ORF Transcript_40205/g.96354 Transcript_40205/m.96354 type:complete len:282 (+) Transcript_40205:81-926(+)